MSRYISLLLLFIGLVFCQNSATNKVALSEPEPRNIARESIKESMKKSMKTYSTPNLILASIGLGVSGIYLGEFIYENTYEDIDNGEGYMDNGEGEDIDIDNGEGDLGNVIILAPGILGFGLPYYISRITKMRSWKIERNNFINNYSDIGDIAEGKGGGELWWQKGAIKQGETYNIGGGISYQDLSSIYNNELAAIGAKNSIDKNNKINSPSRSLMVNLFKYSAGISLTLMAVAIDFPEIAFAGMGAMMFINTKNKFSFDKEKEKYLDGLSKSQIIQFSQIYDPIIEDYEQTYGQDVKKNQLINKKQNIITGCIAGGILASAIILIAIGNIQIIS